MTNKIKLKILIASFSVLLFSGCSMVGVGLSSSVDDALQQNDWEEINTNMTKGTL